MRYLWRVLTNPTSISLIGLISISAIIWWNGPFISFYEYTPLEKTIPRLVLIAVLFQIWILVLLYRYLRDRFFASQINKQVAAETKSSEKKTKEEITIVPGKIETENEISILNKKMAQALASLRKVKIRGIRRGHYLYQRPWYLLIGAPGAGKTTLLLKSGLKFLLTDKFGHRSVGGVGGTRHCDWWFTEEAVLLDTAGRYTTQDSYATVDKASWLGFLDIIKRNRRQKPINGVIVTISLLDLLTKDSATRTAHAIAIRNRIFELQEKFTIRFPIYIMISKCDLLQGFVEFFNDLNKNDREQVWGMTFPNDTIKDINASLHMFPSAFLELEKALQSKVISRMHDEHNLNQRAVILTFPQQFAFLGEIIEQFLAEVLLANPNEENTMLRGIYFTSSTQEGSPIDRILGAMSSVFNLDRQALIATSGKSYFVTKLLKLVIFPESHLAGSVSKYNILLLWSRRIGITGLVAMFITFSYLLWQSYSINNHYLHNVLDRAKLLATTAAQPIDSTSLLAILPVLDAAELIYQTTKPEEIQIIAFPLSQVGNMEEESIKNYNRLLKEALLPRMISRIQVHLNRGSAYKLDYLYQLLRVYIMLGESQHFQIKAIEEWFSYDLNNNLPSVSKKDIASLIRHTTALSHLLEDEITNNEFKIDLDYELVNQTQRIMAHLSIKDWIFEKTTKDISHKPIKGFSIADAAGSQASAVFYRKSGEPLSRGISGIYTIEGYLSFKKALKLNLDNLAKNSWVFAQEEALNTPERIDTIYNSVIEQYFRNYINVWVRLLDDINIVQFSSVNQGIWILNLLSADESPLRKLLNAIIVETTLTPVSESGTVTKNDTGVIELYKNKLSNILNNNEENKLSDNQSLPTIVDVYFDPLAKFVGKNNGNGAPLDALLTDISEIANYFQAMNSNLNDQVQPLPGNILSMPTLTDIELPKMINNFIASIKNSSVILTTNNEIQRLNLLWSSSASIFCQQAINGRYPNNNDAENDISPDDFGRFFAKNGLIDSFFDKNLKHMVNTTGKFWRWRENNWGSEKPSTYILQQFQNANRIRDSFFTKGGQKPSATFEIQILSVSSQISNFDLNIEGQSLLYSSDSSNNRMIFQVPSGKSKNESSLSITVAGKNIQINTSGYWSWWRLMDKGILEKTTSLDKFHLTFNLQGHLVVFRIQASSVYNSIDLQPINKFRCPRQIILIGKK